MIKTMTNIKTEIQCGVALVGVGLRVKANFHSHIVHSIVGLHNKSFVQISWYVDGSKE